MATVAANRAKKCAKNAQQRRNNGEGSIYFREDKNLWCASLQVGIDTDGSRKRKVIYAKTEKELIAKKRELEASVTTGTVVIRLTFFKYVSLLHSTKKIMA